MGRLLARIAIPSSAAMFVTSTYNLADTIFVGRGVNAEAIGAVTLVMPFQFFVMAFGSLLGIGASSIVSRALGAHDQERAQRAAGTSVSAAVVLGLLITAVGSLMPRVLVRLIGASDELMAPTVEYLRIILLNEPLIMLSLSANSLIRAEGQARVAMMTMIIGMVANIVLDPLFIFVFHWGIAGAAWATLIGRVLTVLLILRFYVAGKGTVTLTLRSLRPDWEILRETSTVGSSGFVRQVSTSFVQMFRNHLLVVFGGTLFLSAFGAVFRSISFLSMPAMGIAQALPPIAGYNYGAGRMDRVRRSLWVSMGACLVLTWAGFAFMQGAPRLLLRLFSSDPAYLARGVSIMRINAFNLISFPVYFMGPAFYQALGKSMRALILALTRPVLALAIMSIGIRLVGPLGVVAADPIAIALGAVMAILFLRNSLRTLDPKAPPAAGGVVPA